jgi:fused signal recognition particle receptor
VSFLGKITEGLRKTRDAILGQAAAVLRPGRKLSEEDYEALETALLRADVGPEAAERVLAGVRKRLADATHHGDAADALREEIATLLRVGSGTGEGLPQGPNSRAGGAGPQIAPGQPSAVPDPSHGSTSTPATHVTLVVGVNGTGKTTSIAKLAHRYRLAGDSVLLVAADTFRAAAADQLEVWAERAGVAIVSASPGADPASVAFDGMSRALHTGARRVLVDTAGRLHVKSNLMEELKKIRRVIERALPGAPHETLLVLDATTGQNGLQQAREFHRALGVTGLALTKLDGTAKGGVVLAIAETLRIPIRWVGVGEGMEDLVPFDPAEFAAALVAAA